MPDDYTSQAEGLESPAVHGVIWNPNDNADLPFVTRGIALSAASPLRVVFASGQAATIPSGFLAAGIVHPLRLSKIFATGTTATQVLILR